MAGVFVQWLACRSRAHHLRSKRLAKHRWIFDRKPVEDLRVRIAAKLFRDCQLLRSAAKALLWVKFLRDNDKRISLPAPY